MPARDRHALSARAVCRDRRVGAVRSSRPARRLPRHRPLASTPPARSAGSERSPRPARPTPDGCWSRAPTTTAAARRSVKRQGAASAGKHRRSSTSPGARNAGATPAGANSKTRARSPTESSRSRSPANSPATAGRSPPGHPIPTRYRRHPCRRATPSHTQPRSHTSTHQPPAGDSPTHANPLTTRCGSRGGPSIPGSRTTTPRFVA